MNNQLQAIYELYTHQFADLPPESGVNSSFDNIAGVWHVGDLFSKQDVRVLFLGKTARGGYTREHQELLLQTADQLWEESSWAFWSYSRAIVQSLFPKDDILTSYQKIAITNLIKTNDWISGKSSQDQTSPIVADYWIYKNPVFKAEIDILQPTHVIAYVGKSYVDDLVSSLNLDNVHRSVNDTVLAFGDTDKKTKVIITRHPERANKVKFVADIISVI